MVNMRKDFFSFPLMSFYEHLLQKIEKHRRDTNWIILAQASLDLWWWSTSTSPKSSSPLTPWSEDWRPPRTTTISRRSNRGILSSGDRRFLTNLILAKQDTFFQENMEFPNLHCNTAYFAMKSLCCSSVFFLSQSAQLIVVSAHQGLCEQVQSGGCKLRNSDQKRKFLPGEVHSVPIQPKGSKLPGEL